MTFINRRKKKEVQNWLKSTSAVVLLGQRQVGKTTLAKEIAGDQDADYLNLNDTRTAAMLDRTGLHEYVAESNRQLTVIDEIQVRRRLFADLMVIIDEKRWLGKGKGCFLLLGSGSLNLANKSNESLRGRVSYVHLDPLDITEVDMPSQLGKLWQRGGLPGIFTAESDREAFDQHRALAETLSKQDMLIEGAGGATPSQITNILEILAGNHGGMSNILKISQKLDLDRRAVKHCIKLLEEMLVVRVLRPYGRSRVKNIAKTPKIYLCDSGMLHYFLRVENTAGLTPLMAGMSWEGFVIENIRRQVDYRTDAYFYRTKSGNEIDLILRNPMLETWAIEIKKSEPKAGVGFYKALKDIEHDRSFLVHGRLDLPRCRDEQGIEILSLPDMCQEVAARFGP